MIQNSINIPGIILAAGRSSRMGRIKQLLDFEGRTMLEQIMNNALESSLNRVIVVLGHAADQIRNVVSFDRVQVIINDRYDQGISTSLQAGLAGVRDDEAGAVFILGDQPLVGSEVINKLVKAYQQKRAPLVIPFCRGERGNPVLVDRALFSRLKTLTGDIGARALFEEYANRIKKVEIEDTGILFDLDTWDDYEALKNK